MHSTSNCWRRAATLSVIGVLLWSMGSASLFADQIGRPDERKGNEVLVAAFGAIPDDGQDDTRAFQLAAEACRAMDSPRLVLDPGRYDFGRSQMPYAKGGAFLSFAGKSGMQIVGNGAVLVFADRVTPMVFTECENVRVSGVTIDWVHPFFSQGRVLSADRLAFDVQVEVGYPVDGTEPIEGILDYDPESKWPLSNIDVLASSAIESVKLVAKQTLRLKLKEQSAPMKHAHVEAVIKEMPGRLVVLRHVIYGNHAMDFINCTGVVVEDVTIYASPGMGVHSQTSRDITLNRVSVRIRPGSGRLMSTTADAQFFSHTSGFVKINTGFIEGSGDDGLNVSGKYKTLTRIVDENTVEAVVVGPSWEGPTPRAGDKIEICRRDDLTTREVVVVKDAAWNRAEKKFIITFTSPISRATEKGDLLANQTYLPSLV